VISTLRGFAYTDGAYPWASLIEGAPGTFYGTTEAGGASGYGSVFKVARTELTTFA
jgi:uncharacterized repeat protein (TIGR03803 family)